MLCRDQQEERNPPSRRGSPCSGSQGVLVGEGTNETNKQTERHTFWDQWEKQVIAMWRQKKEIWGQLEANPARSSLVFGRTPRSLLGCLSGAGSSTVKVGGTGEEQAGKYVLESRGPLYLSSVLG